MAINGVTSEKLDALVQDLKPWVKQVHALKDISELLTYVGGNKTMIQTLAKEREGLDATYREIQEQKKQAEVELEKAKGAVEAKREQHQHTLAQQMADASRSHEQAIVKLRAQLVSEENNLKHMLKQTADAKRNLASSDSEWNKREQSLNELHEQEVQRRTKELARLESQIGTAKAELAKLRERFKVE